MKSSAPARFVTYIRVSTQKQGASGLGLEAQQSAIAEHLARHGGEVIGEFIEVETGKGSDALSRRPKLQEALTLAKTKKATLVIAKLDRLARNLHFVTGLIESGVSFACLDVPEGGKQMVQMKAMVAEWEADMISQRTKDALAAAKARGVKLGVKAKENAAAINQQRQQEGRERAEAMRADLVAVAGLSMAKAAAELAQRGHLNSKGEPLTPMQVKRLRERLTPACA